ncbi:hypothetical protein DL96DRAFT_1703090 [Flagelloscypha sp. PMI_526]|nr:hypothetical protein DL96DRAFT_1703090 [Flagelloscypha sp. PMI_526]
MSTTDEILFNKCLTLTGLTLLYWDHIVTLGDEIQCFWRRANRAGIWCFFINRYLSFFANIPLWIVTFFHMNQEILLVVTQIIVGILLGIRVWALYACSPKIKYYMISVSVILIGIAVWGVATSHATYDNLDCSQSLSHDAAVHVATAWECLFIYDLNIIVLTLYRSRQATFQYGVRHKVPLVQLIVRDGSVYFCVMLFANLANILTFYLASARIRGGLSTFASAVSVSMMSRLMINLHKNASHILDPTSQQPPNVTHTLNFHLKTQVSDGLDSATMERTEALDDDVEIFQVVGRTPCERQGTSGGNEEEGAGTPRTASTLVA